MSFRYCYYYVEYNCHPETCCHEEHYRFAVYKVGPTVGPFGPYKYTPKEILMYSDDKSECESYLSQFKNNMGLREPFMLC